MKKQMVFVMLTLLASVSHAQLVVDSLGKAAFGTTTSSDYQMNVWGAKSGINCVAGQGSPYSCTAINATVYHGPSGESVGIKGIVQPVSFYDGFCIGVYGRANASSGGKNIGLYGSIIPYYNGTGLYASSSNYNGLHALTSRYAGYFDGDTYVDGGLTVSGVLLNSSSSSSSSSSLLGNRSESRQSAMGQLRQLEPTAYYIEQRSVSVPEPTSLLPSSAETKAEADKTAKEIPMSLIERQVISKLHYGLDADQLEEIFPDLVYENEGGGKSINYVEMVPILIQAIKELSDKVEILESESTVKRTKKTTGVIDSAEKEQVLSLGQNKPNPFSGSTDIAVSVPKTIQNAFIYVYDLQGKKVQQVDITARGRQTVKLAAADLAEGMYLYSLIADGKVVETRRMIIEK